MELSTTEYQIRYSENSAITGEARASRLAMAAPMMSLAMNIAAVAIVSTPEEPKRKTFNLTTAHSFNLIVKEERFAGNGDFFGEGQAPFYKVYWQKSGGKKPQGDHIFIYQGKEIESPDENPIKKRVELIFALVALVGLVLFIVGIAMGNMLMLIGFAMCIPTCIVFLVGGMFSQCCKGNKPIKDGRRQDFNEILKLADSKIQQLISTQVVVVDLLQSRASAAPNSPCRSSIAGIFSGSKDIPEEQVPLLLTKQEETLQRERALEEVRQQNERIWLATQQREIERGGRWLTEGAEESMGNSI